MSILGPDYTASEIVATWLFLLKLCVLTSPYRHSEQDQVNWIEFESLFVWIINWILLDAIGESLQLSRFLSFLINELKTLHVAKLCTRMYEVHARQIVGHTTIIVSTAAAAAAAAESEACCIRSTSGEAVRIVITCEKKAPVRLCKQMRPM